MDPSVRRILIRLGAAYAFGWATISMIAGPGSAALVDLTGNLEYAGLFVAIVYLGSAAGAPLGGRAMDRFGRKRPLVVAYAVWALSLLTAGIGIASASLVLFLAGIGGAAAAFGTVNLTRVAVAELFPPSERGRGVAWVQISAIFGAITGPLLLLLSDPLGAVLGRSPLTLIWFLGPPLLLVSAFLAAGAPEPARIAAAAAGTGSGTPLAAQTGSPSTRLVLAGAVSLAASQAAMASVMGVTGAAVAHAGHGVDVLGGLMFAHFIGMFALSRVVGTIADRVGRRRTILTGLSLLALGGATVAAIPGPRGFAVGLMLVGLGWSFGYIGATVLLTDVTAPSSRARTLGRADLGAQLTSSAVASAGGWWFAAHGVAGLGILAIAVAALPVILLMLVSERAPGRYASQPAS